MGAPKGRIPWNKNLTKETDARVKKYTESSSKSRVGIKQSTETVEKRVSKIRGIARTEEVKKKISLANKGKQKNIPAWNRGLTKETDERIKRISIKLTGKRLSENHVQKLKIVHLGRKNSIASKRKNRLFRIKQIKENYGNCWPNYNKKACDFFKSFDESHNTKGRYAVYGDGEHYIEDLGYWVDYINFDKKIIIEYDEKYHEKQKEKDILRQKEIQEFYPDFEFIRIIENDTKRKEELLCKKIIQ